MSGFKKIDFESERDMILEELMPGRNKVVRYEYDEDLLGKALDFCSAEYELIAVGASQYTKKAIHDKIIPCQIFQKKLKADPSPTRLDQFLKLVKQDYGRGVEKAFRKEFEGVFREESKEDS